MAAEGKMAFKRNKTSQYLTNLKKDDPKQFAAVMKKIRKTTRKWERQYTNRSALNEQRKADKVKMAKAAHDQRIRKKKRLETERQKYIRETGGECKCTKDVDDLVEQFTSKTQKLTVLRKYTTYLKSKNNLSKAVPERLKTALAFDNPQEKNSVDKLKANLKELIKYIKEENLPPPEVHEEDTESDGDEEVADGGMEDEQQIEEEEDIESDEEEGEESMEMDENLDTYTSWKLADTVAVAFEDSFYLGVVSNVVSENVATLNWLKPRSNGKWDPPSTKADEASDVEMQFVFAWGFELIRDSSMRSFTLDKTTCEEIRRKYNAYYNKYFAPKH